jgi:hypothetical protein
MFPLRFVIKNLFPTSQARRRLRPLRSGPGEARTILLFHTISARPSKQPRMVGSTLGVCSFGLIFVSARTNKKHHHQAVREDLGEPRGDARVRVLAGGQRGVCRGVDDRVCFITAGPITKLFAWGGGSRKNPRTFCLRFNSRCIRGRSPAGVLERLKSRQLIFSIVQMETSQVLEEW